MTDKAKNSVKERIAFYGVVDVVVVHDGKWVEDKKYTDFNEAVCDIEFLEIDNEVFI